MKKTIACCALAALCLAVMRSARAADAGRPSWLPTDATATASCVEALGDIYWNPKRLPFGPTYGVHDGKPVFEEVMIAQRDFQRGFDLNDVAKPVPPFLVDHVDIWFVPHGHEGFEQPHYDILLVFMPHATHMHLCGNTSGALPDFVLPQ
jgi:hypothetical protein